MSSGAASLEASAQPRLRTDLLLAALLVALACALILPTIGQTTGMMRSHHGLYHSASIYQIWNGILPPTNPLNMEGPAFSYWGWYLLLASAMRALDISAFEAALYSNALALALLFVGILFGTRLFRATTCARLALCFLPLSILAPHAFGMECWDIGNARIDLIAKFLNFNSFPLAVGLFACVLPLYLRPGGGRAPGVILCALLSAAISFLHPTSSVALLMLALSGVLYHVLMRRRGGTEAEALGRSAALVAGFAVAFPHMNSLRLSLGQATSILTSPAEIAANLGVAGFSLLVPVLILLAGALRFKRLGAAGTILWLTCLQLAVGSLLIEIPGNNQYKLNLLLAVPSTYLLGAIVTGGSAQSTGRSPRRSFLPRFALLTSFLLLLAAGTRTLHGYAEEPWSLTDTYAFDGPNVDLNVAGEEPAASAAQEAYLWLRTNTPPTAYVLVRPRNMNAMTMPVIAQRRAVCASGRQDLHYGFPHQNELLEGARLLVDQLESSGNPAARLRSLLAIALPWPESFFVLVKNARAQPLGQLKSEAERWQCGLSVRFANDGWVVYEFSNGG